MKPEGMSEPAWDEACSVAARSRKELFDLAKVPAARLWAIEGVIEAMNDHFARAIMAERERIATMIDSGEYEQRHYEETYSDTIDNIVYAIRNS